MKEYEIKITGSGTIGDIIVSLYDIIHDMEVENDESGINIMDPYYEDPTLCVVITEKEE